MQCKIQVLSLGWEDPVEKGMATHSSILAWRIQGERSLVGYSPWGCKELDWATFTFHRYRHRYRDKHRSLARWVVNQRRLKLMAKSSWLGWLLPESTTHSTWLEFIPTLSRALQRGFQTKTVWNWVSLDWRTPRPSLHRGLGLLYPTFLPSLLHSGSHLHCRQTTLPASAGSLIFSHNQWTSEVAQSCPTLCNPMDCSLLGSSFNVIFQARVPEWIAISFSRGSSRLRDRTQVSHTLPSLPPGKPFSHKPLL